MNQGSQRIVRTAAWFAGGIAIGFAAARWTGAPVLAPPATPPAAAPPTLPATVTVSDEALRTVDIGVETVAMGDVATEVRGPGTAVAGPDGDAAVAARAAGTVTRILHRLGEPVKSGELLALIESREAAAMAAERTAAESRAVQARQQLEREQALYEQKVTARQELEAAQAQAAAAEAEAARARSAAIAGHVAADGRSVEVRSPIAGWITAVDAAVGAFVTGDAVLFRVTDPRQVRVEASVTAADSRRIAVGDAASVSTSTGTSLKATVLSLTPALKETNRTATVVLAIAPGQAMPVPGEFVEARIQTRTAGAIAPIVPEDAVQSIDGRDVVFVRNSQGFSVRPVQVGLRSGGRATLLSGVKAGESIATRNAFLLKAELKKGAGDDEE